MSSRSISCDRFLTDSFTADISPEGLLIRDNTMKTVLVRHLKELAPHLDHIPTPSATGRRSTAAAPVRLRRVVSSRNQIHQLATLRSSLGAGTIDVALDGADGRKRSAISAFAGPRRSASDLPFASGQGQRVHHRAHRRCFGASADCGEPKRRARSTPRWRVCGRPILPDAACVGRVRCRQSRPRVSKSALAASSAEPSPSACLGRVAACGSMSTPGEGGNAVESFRRAAITDGRVVARARDAAHRIRRRRRRTSGKLDRQG